MLAPGLDSLIILERKYMGNNPTITIAIEGAAASNILSSEA